MFHAFPQFRRHTMWNRWELRKPEAFVHVSQDMLKWVLKSFRITPTCAKRIAGALLELGRIEDAQKVIADFELRVDGDFAVAAAKGGNIEVLAWVQGESPLAGFIRADSAVCAAAAERGHLHLLKWAVESGFATCPLVFVRAAANGHTHICEWANDRDIARSYSAMNAAAQNGHFHTVKWFRYFYKTSEWLPGSSVCTAAARGGHLHILKWLTEYDNQYFPLSWNALRDATFHGHVDVVLWLLSKGCPRHDESFRASIVDTAMCMALVRSGNLEMVKLLPRVGFSIGFSELATAVESGQLPIVRWLLEHERWAARMADQRHDELVALARKNGHGEVENYILTNVRN